MASKLHAISTSDWHLEGLTKLFPNDHLQRQFHELTKIYEYALDNGINHVFIPGDISDTYSMKDETYIELVMFFKKYDGIINSYYSIGNHDHKEGSKTSIDLLHLLCVQGFFKTLKIYKNPEQLVIDGVVVNFIPFGSKESIPNKKPCLNFVHESYDGAVGDNGRTMKVKNEFQSSEKDFAVSGHIHQYQHLKRKRVVLNGNPYQKNFGESLPKGFIEFTAYYKNKKLIFKHEFINNRPDFTLESVLIRKQKDFAKLSSEDNIRYRLYVDPSVVIPIDLRMKYANVAQILDSGGKKKIKELDSVESFQQHSISIPKIDPLANLQESMEIDGWEQKDYDLAENFIKDAISTF